MFVIPGSALFKCHHMYICVSLFTVLLLLSLAVPLANRQAILLLGGVARTQQAQRSFTILDQVVILPHNPAKHKLCLQIVSINEVLQDRALGADLVADLAQKLAGVLHR